MVSISSMKIIAGLPIAASKAALLKASRNTFSLSPANALWTEAPLQQFQQVLTLFMSQLHKSHIIQAFHFEKKTSD